MLSRLNFELIMHIENLMKLKHNSLFSYSLLNFNKFWACIFQLESIRATRFERLLLTKDNKSLLVRQYIANIKLHKIVPYHQYLFNFFIFKMQVILQSCISSFPVSLNSSLLSVDLFLNKFLYEYKKRLFIFYNDFYFQNKFIVSNLYLRLETFNLNFQENKFFRKSFSVVEKDFLFLEVFASSQYCINKLIDLGFFHKFKFRSIGNSKLINFDDSFIINKFSCIAYNFLNWFRCCRNFFFIRKLINFVRESCFLTLCRKHNKYKNWVYSVYTKDLSIIYTFNSSSFFFPTVSKLSKLKRKFYFFVEKLFVDEAFFLD